jgi:hypothetical protein
MVYSEAALVVGLFSATFVLHYYSSLATFGMVLEQFSVMYSRVLILILMSKLNLVHSRS